jgi:ribosomal protein S18 acetylase RimI-like enzyme
MLTAAVVRSDKELQQIHTLNQQNIKHNLSADERAEEGFVSWLYSIPLLQQMHELAPSVIVKNNDDVVGYALSTPEGARSFHPDLETMFGNLESVQYNGKDLFNYKFYCMGQICVAKQYRGIGVVNMLYQKHREVYSSQFDFILTEISTSNLRSIKAHERIGFKTIHTYKDVMDEWNVVVWDWTAKEN